MSETMVALVTGASRGIGKAIAQKFEREGWKVHCPSRQELDLAEPESIEAYFQNYAGELNTVVNNAGINPIGTIELTTLENTQNTINVNLIAPLLVSRFAYPFLRRARGVRRVVNIGSIWGVVSKPGRSIYSMSKSGVVGLTRTAALEWASEGILVNTLAPGFTRTELTMKNNTIEDLDKITAMIPLNRLAEPEEIAKAAFFLGSEQNSYITGQTIIIDGGYACA